MTNWQPIDTAPKDGNALLLNIGWPWPIMGMWNDCQKEWVCAYPQCNVVGGQWNDTYFENEYDTPTHWMPLPELPEVE